MEDILYNVQVKKTDVENVEIDIFHLLELSKQLNAYYKNKKQKKIHSEIKFASEYIVEAHCKLLPTYNPHPNSYDYETDMLDIPKKLHEVGDVEFPKVCDTHIKMIKYLRFFINNKIKIQMANIMDFEDTDSRQLYLYQHIMVRLINANKLLGRLLGCIYKKQIK